MKNLSTWNLHKGHLAPCIAASICEYSGVLAANQIKKAFPLLIIPKECVKRLYDDKEEQLELNEWADTVLNIKTRMHQDGHRYFKTLEGTIVFPWYLWEYPIYAMYTTNQDSTLSSMFHKVVKQFNMLRKNSSPDPEEVEEIWYCNETFCSRFVDCLMSICGGYFGFVRTVKIRTVDTSQVIRIKSALFNAVIQITITEKTVPNFEASEIFMKHYNGSAYEYLGASVSSLH